MVRYYFLSNLRQFFSVTLDFYTSTSSWFIWLLINLSDFCHSSLLKQSKCPSTDEWIKKMWCVYICFHTHKCTHRGFPGSSDGKESACSTGDLGLSLGLRRSSGGGNGNPFQYFCLENPMDREAWRATLHGVTKSRT